VRFSVPSEIVLPVILPPVILAVAPDCICRPVRFAFKFNVPFETSTDAPDPLEIFVVPPSIITDPPVTVTFERLMEVISVPFVEIFPVTDPPVKLAVPD